MRVSSRASARGTAAPLPGAAEGGKGLGSLFAQPVVGPDALPQAGRKLSNEGPHGGMDLVLVEVLDGVGLRRPCAVVRGGKNGEVLVLRQKDDGPRPRALAHPSG